MWVTILSQHVRPHLMDQTFKFILKNCFYQHSSCVKWVSWWHFQTHIRCIWVIVTPSSFLTPSHSHHWIFMMQSWRNRVIDAERNILPLTANLIEPDSPLGLPYIMHQVPSSKDTKLSGFTWEKEKKKPTVAFYLIIQKCSCLFQGCTVEQLWGQTWDMFSLNSNWNPLLGRQLKTFLPGDSWVLY